MSVFKSFKGLSVTIPEVMVQKLGLNIYSTVSFDLIDDNSLKLEKVKYDSNRSSENI